MTGLGEIEIHRRAELNLKCLLIMAKLTVYLTNIKNAQPFNLYLGTINQTIYQSNDCGSTQDIVKSISYKDLKY